MLCGRRGNSVNRAGRQESRDPRRRGPGRNLLPSRRDALVLGPGTVKVARYRWLFGLSVVLGMLPVFVAWTLMDTEWAERRASVQWGLALVAFAGALFLVCLLVFPWSRPLWLQANLYKNTGGAISCRWSTRPGSQRG